MLADIGRRRRSKGEGIPAALELELTPEAKRIITGQARTYELMFSRAGAVEAAAASTQEQQPERAAPALPRPIKNSAVVWLKFYGQRWWGKNRCGAEFDDYLSDAWVKENFEAWFLLAARATRGQWRKIPEGKGPTQPSAGVLSFD